MKLFIYIQSQIFSADNAETELYKSNIQNLFALDILDNGLMLENINDVTIEALIKEHIKEIQPNNYGEELLPFNGGVYIKFNEKHIDSNCCGDISNVENWREILYARNTHWETLWIGHPEIAYKFDDKNIYLSDYIEGPKEIETKFEFNKNEFLELLRIKLNLFDSFKEQAYKVIDNMNKENGVELKKVLF